ncbi:MAG TPA: tetratricopeptide repeat protein [Verrucomicrobiae bacterium]|nr:tetratricopeptide repeat protein [Verrucomicrobiae bacterium]
MKRSKRKSGYSVLALGILLLALASGGCTRSYRAARHLSRGNQYYDAGQFDKAEIEYLIVLRADASNAPAIGRLGLIYCAQGRYARAVPFLAKAQTLSPDNLEVRKKLAEIYLSVGKLAEARDEAVFVLDRNPRDDEAPLLLAGSSVSTNAMVEARERLQAVVRKAGETAALDVGLAHLEQARGDYPAAAADLERAKALDAKSSSVFWAYGNLYFAQNDQKRAEEAFRAAADLAPARSPRRLRYAQYEIEKGDLEAGKKLLHEIGQTTPDYLPAWQWLAEIALREKKYDESAELIRKALARDPLNYEALSQSGRLSLAKGDRDEAVNQFKKLAEVYPQSAEAQYELATGYLARNEIGQAVISLNQALSLSPTLAKATVLLAGLQMKSGNVDAAIAALRTLVEKQPHLVPAQLLLADAYRVQGNFESAIKVYDALEKLVPRAADVPFLMGMTLLQQKKTTEARAAFSRALELSPDDFAAVEQLVDMDLVDKQYKAALQRIQPLLDRNPKAAEGRLIQAKIYLAQSDAKQAESALLKAIELRPDSRAAHLMLARLYVDNHQEQKALDDLRAFLEKNPKEDGAWMLMAMTQERQKDYHGARDTYEKLLAMDPRYVPAMNNLAWLYAERLGQLNKGYEIASKAHELQPLNPLAADTLGWILYRMKQYPRAARLLQESAAKLGGQPDVQLHLGLAYYMLGREEPARAALQRALDLKKDVTGRDEADQCLTILGIDAGTAGMEQRAELEKRVAAVPDDPVARVRLGAIYQRDGNYDRAIQEYQAVVAASADDVLALVNLARLYAERLHDLPRAMEYAKAANKAAPNDAAVSRVLGRLVFQTGDYKWAASLLQQASQQQPQNPEVSYDYALAAYSVGQVSNAAAAARAALNAGPAFSRADAATRFLDMLALAGDPTRAVAEASRVENALKSEPNFVPALMVMGLVDEQEANAHVAEQVYEKALSVYPEFGPAKRRLAIIYAAEAPMENPKALPMAAQAREIYPNDPEVAKALGIAVYRRGDFVRSAALLKESAAKLTSDATVMYYLGMAQLRNNELAESKRSLQRALDLNLDGELKAGAKQALAQLK